MGETKPVSRTFAAACTSIIAALVSLQIAVTVMVTYKLHEENLVTGHQLQKSFASATDQRALITARLDAMVRDAEALRSQVQENSKKVASLEEAIKLRRARR